MWNVVISANPVAAYAKLSLDAGVRYSSVLVRLVFMAAMAMIAATPAITTTGFWIIKYA